MVTKHICERRLSILGITYYILQFFIIIFIIELTHSKTILGNTVEFEPQPVVFDFKNLSQYSSHSK